MSKGLRIVAVALGLTTAWTAWLMDPLVKPSHDIVMHWAGSANALFGPAALIVLAVWAALTLLLLSAQAPGRWRAAVWLAILLATGWVGLRMLAGVWALPWLGPHVTVMLLIAWVVLIPWALWRRQQAVIEFMSTVFAFAALSGVLFLTEMGWFWWQARALNKPAPLHQVQAQTVARDPKPRIVWIVLDELSYQEVYEERYPGLQLPAFDALAAESTVFSNIVPAGVHTERVLPALLTGKPVDDVRSTPGGELLVHNRAKGWSEFAPHDTVVQDALNAGYSTAVAGWFNPYCRMMPAVLDHCYWISGDPTFGGNMRSAKVRFKAIVLGNGELRRWLMRWLRFPPLHRSGPSLHIAEYEDLSAAADKVLRDPSADFALLHLPIPHPPGIYSRATGQLTTGQSSYVDNLALADRYLAHVRSVLEQSGQWDSSTVIVMGDHGWRTSFLWRTFPGWTEEDERASDGGKFDRRPAYIVKLAGQHEGARIDAPFRAVETRALLDAVMNGKIRSAAELRVWVGEDRRPARHVAMKELR